MRIIGPNCLGVMSPPTGLNATFASSMAKQGSVGFISQSGALCTAILDWSLQENVGFSAFISIGSMLDVDWGDLINYLGDDPSTHSIILYMESIGNPTSFLSAARQVALSKPIIVLKTGSSEAAARAAASHTGALAGRDAVLEAAFRRSGVLRVRTIAELFYMADVLAKQPRPRGPRLAIVTNAGGPAVLATDSLVVSGGALATLDPETVSKLDEFLPSHWSHQNPVDVLGDADSSRYSKAVQVVSQDSNNDGLLVILAPQAMTDPTQTAEALKGLDRLDGKPLLASWMGGATVAAGESILASAAVPNFPYPDTAVRIFENMWRYSYNLRGLYETPALVPSSSLEAPGRHQAREMTQAAREAGRTLLTEFESKQLLAAYGIPVVETRVAQDADQAVKTANEVGFPAAVKLHSKTITHKTDVGGVRLDLPNERAVRDAFRAIQSSVGAKVGPEHFLGVTVQPMIKREGYELILGSSIDTQFGPVLLFGAGGQLVELYQDRALGLPPLNTTLARRMMEQTLIYKALQGVRGREPVDLGELERVLVRFSQLVIEQRQIREIDINPLLASADGLLALDARVVLHPSEVTDDQLPRPVIRPYPVQYTSAIKMNDGTSFTVRPIRPEDEPLMVKFHQALSDRSVYMRYFRAMRLDHRIAHERLTRICFIDYDREMALVADCGKPGSGGHEIAAVARLSRLHGSSEAEFAIVVSDKFQRRGLGSAMLRKLIELARAEGLSRIGAEILAENIDMLRLCRKLKFQVRHFPGEITAAATLDL
ncbi:MAG TPA: bifunctional acetate--CoA ligase family protein/GNAT family N-acetyltransferase [Terriglobales bacterium]